ncbi:hypothetical protein U5801_25670 [Lamprobacter modestohalophilus]|nr:hypothetical protein [Lamprobacter modestohalophilus]MEA1053170.1 hypothetical protein [Lamprobacter modestohalophilus]
MANSAVLRFHIPPRFRRLIDALVEHNKQIRSLGINFNQLCPRR